MENPISILKKLSFKDSERKYPNVPNHAIPIPKYSDRTTNGLTKCIIDFLNLSGHHAERINSTGRIIDNRKTKKGIYGKSEVGSLKWVKGNTQNGTADISATIKGRSVKIEVKCEATGDKYQSQAQKRYKAQIESAGGLYFIARTFNGFYNWYISKMNNNEK